MPTYQYLCTECGHNLDAKQSFTDDALTVCPECSGRLRKVFNAVGVVFKGSGFYKTDSRAAAQSSNGSSSAESSTASTGSDGASKSEASESAGSGKPDASKSSERKSTGDSAAKSTTPASA